MPKYEVSKSSQRIIYPALVVSVDDPKDLGRVRAEPEDVQILSVLKAYDNFKLWNDDPNSGPIDPFVVRPLLPIFLSQPLIESERILIIYQNVLYPWQDSYYVPATFSTPLSIGYENFQGMKKNTGEGFQQKNTLLLRNPKTGKYFNTNSEGIFPRTNDAALLGRGSADVIVKNDEVLIRAGKTQKLTAKEYPIRYDRRAYQQLSNFKETIVNNGKKSVLTLEEDELFVSYLVEYDIDNIENPSQVFTGAIRLYKLRLSSSATTKTINVTSNLEPLKSLVYYENIISKPLSATTTQINEFILKVAQNKLTVGQNNSSGPALPDRFPFVFRPSNDLFYGATGRTSQNNFDLIYQSVGLLNVNQNNALTKDYGFGFVIDAQTTGKPKSLKREDYEEIVSDPTTPVTYNIMGGDKLLLISHLGKPIDLTNTIYGISQQKIIQDVLPNTSALVRGEELMELLNLIVRYIVGHVHPLPGVQPVPVAVDGTSSLEILQKIANATNTILSENIRINWYL